jgi:hypothetical protein
MANHQLKQPARPVTPLAYNGGELVAASNR